MRQTLSVQPILLLSLPRAGSTLVQRVLAAHHDVATVSEPWFLLPLAYSLREEGARAEYWHPLAAMAVNDLADELPGGRDAYLAEIGQLAMRIYTQLADGAGYFVDKTPRYHLIADELPKILPTARFVFLWRNPLAVAASMLKTFRASRFEPHLFSVDLDDGVANLTALWERLEGSGTSVAVRYEDLVSGTEAWRALFENLGLEFDAEILDHFQEVELSGRYGDPTGRLKYTTLSAEPAHRWVDEFQGPVRRLWARRYLSRIGQRRMDTMGYDVADLRRVLDAQPTRSGSVPADALRLLESRITLAAHKHTVRADDSPRPVDP